jgi:chaperonin cofactor prefoldin
MVLGSSMPAAGKRGQKTRCFNCGTYRRFSRIKCHANTVGWDRLDAAVDSLLEIVKDRVGRLLKDPLTTLQSDTWAKECELTKAMDAVFAALAAGPPEVLAGLNRPTEPGVPIINYIIDAYNAMHAGQTETLRAELVEIEADLRRIGALLLEGIPSASVKRQLFDRMAALEARKTTVESNLTPLTMRVESLREQLRAIERTIAEADRSGLAKLLDTFVEKVIPRFDVEYQGPNRKRRAVLRSVEFVPKASEAAKSILPRAMEIGDTHTGTGSWLPPG